MIFVKSILAGFLWLIVGAILFWIGFAVVFAIVRPPGEEAAAIDVVSVCRHFYLRCLIIITSIFALGFSWEYRRLRRKMPSANA